MAGVLQWEYLAPGADVADEQVSIDESGAVGRVVRVSQTRTAELGWWEGQLDEPITGVASTLAARDWAFDEIRSRPPASGSWWVSSTQGRMGLWADPDPLPGDGLRAELAALLSACVSAAQNARCVIRVTSEWTTYDETPVPRIWLLAAGAERVAIVVADPEGAPPAAFTDDGGAIVGFSGSEIWIPAGTSATAMLFGWTPGPRGLDVVVTIADEAGTVLEASAVVTI